MGTDRVHQRDTKYFMLTVFYSEQQWGHSYYVRLFHGEDKPGCFLKAWDGYSLDTIEDELDEAYLARKDEVLANLRSGVDEDISQLEFVTDWDGYDCYSLRILASGFIDTFPEEAIKKTIAYLKDMREKEVDVSADEGEYKPSIDQSAFFNRKIQLLKGLLGKSKTPAKQKLSILRRAVEEINDWFSDNLNVG